MGAAEFQRLQELTTVLPKSERRAGCGNLEVLVHELCFHSHSAAMNKRLVQRQDAVTSALCIGSSC